jgi:broad specificity phosphatase PhoE
MQVLIRAAESLKALAEEAANAPNSCVAAVTHSAFLRILIGLVLDEPLVEVASRKVVNGGITVIDIPKELRFRRLGVKPKLLGGPLSQVPTDFELEVPMCKVVRINEARHLPTV